MIVTFTIKILHILSFIATFFHSYGIQCFRNRCDPFPFKVCHYITYTKFCEAERGPHAQVQTPSEIIKISLICVTCSINTVSSKRVDTSLTLATNIITACIHDFVFTYILQSWFSTCVQKFMHFLRMLKISLNLTI